MTMQRMSFQPLPPARLLRLVLATVALACLGAAAAAIAGGATPKLHVVAGDLNNPRKLFVGPDGAVYVVEAGVGGHDTCLGTGAGKVCVGQSGAITRLHNGTRTKVVTGLWSGAGADRRRAEGPADVVVRGRSYYVLLQDSTIDAKGGNNLGRYGATAGDLVSTPGGRFSPTVLADLAAFEAAHNPDHGAGPGARFGAPPIDSDPYAFTPYRGGFAVVDAAANDLLWISPGGKISVLAVFPTQTEKLSRAVGSRMGAPPTMTSISVQSVPTCVAVGPDGALYVGELTGVPFGHGAARIWRVAGGKASVYASGFTTVSDIAFDGNDLLVLEFDSKGLDPATPGALIRLSPQGKRTLVASTGLVAPTGLAVGNGSIYISNYGIYPGSGAGPHGEVVRLPA